MNSGDLSNDHKKCRSSDRECGDDVWCGSDSGVVTTAALTTMMAV